LDRTDLSLILAAFSALAVFIGPVAALVMVAFVVGVLVGERRKLSRSRIEPDKLGEALGNTHQVSDHQAIIAENPSSGREAAP
jgi:hypothetical protein